MRLVGEYNGSRFEMQIIGQALGYDLRDIIKAKFHIHGPSSTVRIVSLANCGRGEIEYLRSLRILFSPALHETEVHFRVEVPKHERQRSATRHDFVSLSSITWEHVLSTYQNRLVVRELPVKLFSRWAEIRMVAELCCQIAASRDELVEKMIRAVVSLCDHSQSVEYRTRVRLRSRAMKCRGSVDFAIFRGERILVTIKVTQLGDVMGSTALAQTLVAMDLARATNGANGEVSTSMYGVATSFNSWMFLKRSGASIQLDIDQDMTRVAGKLYHIVGHGE